MGDLIDTQKHGDLVYDIGMHRGEDTEFYLRKGFRVVAIEADPDLVRSCRDRLKTFIDNGQLAIVEGAIVDMPASQVQEKKIRFYKNDELSVWGTVHGSWAERNIRLGTSSSTIDVDAINFTSVLEKHGIPYYMKVDIEGCDMVCIAALRRFSVRPDYLSIESDKTSMVNIEREINALVELGYDCFKAIEQSRLHLYQSPPNPAREGQYIAHRFEVGSSGLFGEELNGAWKSRLRILCQYRMIRLGYYLLGDDGIMNTWNFPGARVLRGLARRSLHLLTDAAVPGWYDTHARHSSALGKQLL